MRKSTKIITIVLLPVWYWIIVVNISGYFLRQSTDCYKKAIEFYKKHQIKEAVSIGVTGYLYNQKAISALKWLPEFMRPEIYDEKKINMGRHRKHFSEKTKEFIRSNYESMTIPGMAEALGETASLIYRFMNEENLYRNIAAKGKLPHAAPAEDCFNVFSRENWLI